MEEAFFLKRTLLLQCKEKLYIPDLVKKVEERYVNAGYARFFLNNIFKTLSYNSSLLLIRLYYHIVPILSILFSSFIGFHHPVIFQIPVLLPAFPYRNECCQ